jgi:hypothetical protein
MIHNLTIHVPCSGRFQFIFIIALILIVCTSAITNEDVDFNEILIKGIISHQFVSLLQRSI